MVAVDEADRDPCDNRSLRHLMGEVASRPPPEIAELDNHVHTAGRQLLDHAARPHRIRMRITHKRDTPAHRIGKNTRSHRQTLRPALFLPAKVPIPIKVCVQTGEVHPPSRTATGEAVTPTNKIVMYAS